MLACLLAPYRLTAICCRRPCTDRLPTQCRHCRFYIPQPEPLLRELDALLEQARQKVDARSGAPLVNEAVEKEWQLQRTLIANGHLSGAKPAVGWRVAGCSRSGSALQCSARCTHPMKHTPC